MDNESDSHLIASWKREEAKPFRGWDFSYLADRWVAEEPPWVYAELAKELMATARSLLDIGTGGGERLAALRDYLPPQTTATEGYPPNLRLAREKLVPLGIRVVETSESLEREMPFANRSFDLVIDRHSAFNVAEVQKILTPNGIFLTQQVDGNNLHDLSEAFGCEQPWRFFTLDYVLEKVSSTNLVVEIAQEWTGTMQFKDIGALVYYLRAAPWTVRNFSVETYRDRLLFLNEKRKQGNTLSFQQKLFLLKLRKPQA